MYIIQIVLSFDSHIDTFNKFFQLLSSFYAIWKQLRWFYCFSVSMPLMCAKLHKTIATF